MDPKWVCRRLYCTRASLTVWNQKMAHNTTGRLPIASCWLVGISSNWMHGWNGEDPRDDCRRIVVSFVKISTKSSLVLGVSSDETSFHSSPPALTVSILCGFDSAPKWLLSEKCLLRSCLMGIFFGIFFLFWFDAFLVESESSLRSNLWIVCLFVLDNN